MATSSSTQQTPPKAEEPGTKTETETTPPGAEKVKQALAVDLTEEEQADFEALQQRQINSLAAYEQDRQGLDSNNEIDALDYLLGAPKPRVYEVETVIATPQGDAWMTFVIVPQDGRKLDEIQRRNSDEQGFVADRPKLWAETIEAACVAVKTSKRTVDPASEEFRTLYYRDRETGEVKQQIEPSTAVALATKLRTQSGVLMGVFEQVRRVSGFDLSRIGMPTIAGAEAEAWLQSAAGN